MVNDILFNGQYCFLELPIFSAGQIIRIEAQTLYFILRISLPERISIS